MIKIGKNRGVCESKKVRGKGSWYLWYREGVDMSITYRVGVCVDVGGEQCDQKKSSNVYKSCLKWFLYKNNRF